MQHHSHVTIGESSYQLTAPPVTNVAGSAEKLHVIACINNYVQYKRRYELYWKFVHEMEKHANVVLYTVEIAFGKRAFMVTEASNPRHLQLRTDDEIWHKENSINLMVQRLPADWRYVAWIDADITFDNTNFVEDTIHELQHYEIVQMFQTAVNKGPEGEVIGDVKKSFGWQYANGKQYDASKKRYEYWHPGFAWACTRAAWSRMGGLIDYAILGSADHHMAMCWIGLADKSIHGAATDAYNKRILEYQATCEEHIKRNLGYVKGTIFHAWHGAFKNRKYVERWDILVKNQYDPNTDIKRDWQGLYKLNGTKVGLRDGIRTYMRQRCEDSIDL